MGIIGYTRDEMSQMTVAGFFEAKETNFSSQLSATIKNDKDQFKVIFSKEKKIRSDYLDIAYYSGKFIFDSLILRILHVALAIIKVGAAVLDTLNGIRAMPSVVFGLFLNRLVYQGTSEFFKSTQLLLPRLFKSTVEALNPDAFEDVKIDTYHLPDSFFLPQYFPKLKQLDKEAKKKIKEWKYKKFERFQNLRDPLEKVLLQHLAPRGYYLVKGIFSVAIRIADTICGIFMAIHGIFISLATALPWDVSLNKEHKVQLLNTYKALQIGGICRDVFAMVAKTINPWIADLRKSEALKEAPSPEEKKQSQDNPPSADASAAPILADGELLNGKD